MPHKDKDRARAIELAPGVTVYEKKETGDEFAFSFSVKNDKMALLIFTLDAKDSANMECAEWEDKTRKEVEVQPTETAVIGTLRPVDPDPQVETTLKPAFSWYFRNIDKEQVKELDKANIDAVAALAGEMHANKLFASHYGCANDLEQALKDAGLENFVDVEFMPGDAALVNDAEDENLPPIVWRRPKDFIEHDINVYKDGIHPSDIAQGALGDCWFLASLAALAEYPEMIKQRFVTKEYNECGIYEIQCYKNGQDTKVIVDDYFPCNFRTGRPCYSKAKGGELWPLLLEKAWAKLHGSYQQIEAGIPMHALMDLCGGLGKVVLFRREQEAIQSGKLWEQLKFWDSQRYLMVAGSPGHDNMTKDVAKRPTGGIVPGHAYTVKGCKQFKNVSLVNLRNPWGEFEWEGDWSDESSKWTKRMRRAFRPKLDGNDGDFWMSADDFFKHFDDVSLVYFRGHVGEQWSVSRSQIVTPDKAFCEQLFQFEVERPAVGILGLVQRDERIRGTPPYSDMAFALYGPMKVDGMPAAEVLRSTNYKLFRTPPRELVELIPRDQPLEVGKYQVAVFNPSRTKDVPVVLVVELYGVDEHGMPQPLPKADVETELVDLTEEERAEMVLCTAAHAETSDVKDYEHFDTAGCWMPHGGYAMAVRIKGADPLEMTFDFSSCEGLQVYGSESMEVHKVLQPKEGMQLIAEFIPVGAEGSAKIGYGVRFGVAH